MRDDRLDSIPLADEEEHILRCLGAALIMQWNTLPTKLRRELFDNAGSMGALLETPALRAQNARFLHKHKNGEDTAVSRDPNKTHHRPRNLHPPNKARRDDKVALLRTAGTTKDGGESRGGLPGRKPSADVISERTDDARHQPATDQEEHDDRIQTVEHLFVDEMNFWRV